MDAYPPPPQRAAGGAESFDVGAFIEANGSGADAYFLRDVSPHVEAGAWRWTFAKPQFRFRPEKKPGQRFVLNFTLPDVVFAQTGPVTLTVTINGKKLAEVKYSEPGMKQFAQPVPPEWLEGEETIVEAYLDKYAVAKEDGQALGYILQGVGFQP